MFLSQGVDVGLGLGTSFSVSTGRDSASDIIDVVPVEPTVDRFRAGIRRDDNSHRHSGPLEL